MSYIDNFAGLLNKTATIKRRSWIPDGSGGGAYTTVDIGTPDCALWQKSAHEILMSDRIHNNSTHTMACAVNYNFQADDIVVIDGVTYKMARPDDVMGEADIMTIGLELVE